MTAYSGRYRSFFSPVQVGGTGTVTNPILFQYQNLNRVKVEGIEGRFEARIDRGLTGTLAIAYDRYMRINRHSPTLTGWIHWQDNMKMGMKDVKLVPFVQEMTLNTYTRFDGFKAERADAYWAKTKDYWASVRAGWDAVIKRDGGITVPELAETGSTSGERLMTYADDVEAGKLTTADAIMKAQIVITEVTTTH